MGWSIEKSQERETELDHANLGGLPGQPPSRAGALREDRRTAGGLTSIDPIDRQ